MLCCTRWFQSSKIQGALNAPQGLLYVGLVRREGREQTIFCVQRVGTPEEGSQNYYVSHKPTPRKITSVSTSPSSFLFRLAGSHLNQDNMGRFNKIITIGILMPHEALTKYSVALLLSVVAHGIQDYLNWMKKITTVTNWKIKSRLVNNKNNHQLQPKKFHSRLRHLSLYASPPELAWELQRPLQPNMYMSCSFFLIGFLKNVAVQDDGWLEARIL